MSVQVLLPLQTYPDGNSEALLSQAVAVTNHVHGRIHALVLAAKFPKVSSVLGNLVLDVPSLMAGARENCRKKGARLLEALDREAKAGGVEVHSSELECFPSTFGDDAAVAARFSDLVLVGLLPGDALMQSLAESLIFGSGRPVVLLPEAHTIDQLDQVVIAWDGSRVAARAVSDARLFIERAARVTIAVVTDEKALPENASGSRLAEYLASQGAKVGLVEFSSGKQPIAEILQNESLNIGGGLLVMGGFGHSRMRDFVLGGATRGIIENLRMPVLLSH